MATDLLVAYALLCALAAFVYVLVAGWDLGMGILHPLLARPADRDALFDCITPFWGTMETGWLLGGMTMLLGLPLAYSILPPRSYLSIILMFACLVLRVACYRFRQHGGKLRWVWESCFAAGSLGAAFAQGWILGVLVEDPGTSPHRGAWLSAARLMFPFLCGTGLIGAYGLLGACWLILKTEGAIQTTAREVSASALFLSLVMFLALSGLTRLSSPAVAKCWSSTAGLAGIVLLGGCIAIVGWQLHQSFWGKSDARPLQWAVALVVLAFGVVLVSLYPYIAPYRYKFGEAANDAELLRFASFGLAATLPAIFIYLALAHRVFRGKLQPAACSLPNHCSIASRRTSGAESSLHLS
jgi:cytochrome bd ubiquinol oxidase subunit II